MASSNPVNISTSEQNTHGVTGEVDFTITNFPEDGVFVGWSQTTTASEIGELVRISSDTFRFNAPFLPGSTLVPGIHKDTVVFRVCLDQACLQEIAGSPQTVDFHYTVAPLGAATLGQNELTINVLSIDVHDIAWDAIRNRMYATTSSRSPLAPNSIITLDPATGAVLSTQFAGSDPDALALSDDGSLLYVGFSGANEFKRYALPEMTQDLAVRLSPDQQLSGPQKAIEMDVAPGAPHTVAVSRGTLGFPRLGQTRQSLSVTIYDDAVARPMATQLDGMPKTSIQWGDDATTLYGGDAESSGVYLTRMTVGPSGVTSVEHIGSAGGRSIHYSGGLIYADGGRITNPQTGTSTLLQPGGRIVPDASLNRIFVLSGFGTPYELRSYDATTRAAIGTFTFGSIAGHPRRFMRWGSDGLAFSTDEKELVILRGPFVDGPTPQSALFLSPQSISVSTAPGATEAPTARLHALTTMPFPTGTHFQFNHTSNGIAGISTVDGPQQHTLRLNIGFQSPLGLAPGKYRDVIEIHGCEDAACTQPLPGSPKVAHVLYTVASPRTVSSVGVFTRQLVWNPQAQRFYATTHPTSPANPESLVVIDPATGEFTVGLATGKPNALAISADGQYLYAGLDADAAVQRLQLPALTPDVQIPFATEAAGPYRAPRIEVAPDDPTVVAAVIADSFGNDAVVILDEFGVRQNRDDFDDDLDVFDVVDSIAWGANGGRLYGMGQRLNLLTVDSDGVSAEAHHARESGPGANFADRDVYVNGRLYGANGRVYDPETGDVLGTFPGRGQIVVDPSLSRAFLADFGSNFGHPFGGSIVEAYDLTTFLPAESMTLPCCNSFITSAARWGDDGLAIGQSSANLLVIKGPFVNQSPPP